MPAMNPSVGAANMAGGGMPPHQGGGGQPPMTAVSGGNTTSTQVSEVINSLKQLLPQVVDEKGYVNMDKLVMMWPQFSSVPFQVVMQLIQQSPEMLNQLISQYGLNGISVQGRIISADELSSLGGRGGGGM